MKKLAYILSLGLITGVSVSAQNTDSLNRLQHRGTIRSMATKSGVLKIPGMPAARDYSRPAVSSSVSNDQINPSLLAARAQMVRNYSYPSSTYGQPIYQGQVSPVRSAPGIPNSIRIDPVVPNGNLVPAVVVPIPGVQPVTLPTVPNIVNPIVPIITPITNPIIPIVTPVTNPLVPIITPVTNPLVPIITPIVKPIVPILPPLFPPKK
ncbi:MAG: hypothetical protein V4687_10685 [Bacteroidota bacterium]